MEIQVLGPDLEDAYEAFLRTRDESLIYYAPKFRDFLARLLDCSAHFLVAVSEGQVHGVVPLMFRDSSLGRVYNAMPYYGSNGGILADSPEAAAKLLSAYNKLARHPDTLASTIVQNPFGGAALNAVAHTHRDFRISQYTELSADDDLSRRFDSSARRNINKAIREGITVDTGRQYFDRLRQLHQENMQIIGGLPKTDDFFELVPEMFVENEDYVLYAALSGETMIAGLLVFLFHKTAEYYVPAIDEQYRSIQPLSLLVQAAMIGAIDRGIRVWNWGGSSVGQIGVYRFKRKWDAREGKYEYLTQLNDPGLLGRSSAEILKAFPNFFVVPFTALSRRAA